MAGVGEDGIGIGPDWKGAAGAGHFTLKMEAAWTSGTLVSCHSPEELDLKRHRVKV
jgi:hypothetical protein